MSRDPRSYVANWPAFRQLTGRDRLGRGAAVRSPHTESAVPRTETADRVVSPKGSASKQLVNQPGRVTRVLYRRPYGTAWEPLSLDTAMDMIADRVIATRRQTWQEDLDGKRVRRTLGFASLGGATLDNEENYLIKKLWTALGAIQIENQARI
jgi:formate dehydrogenase major subunit